MVVFVVFVVLVVLVKRRKIYQRPKTLKNRLKNQILRRPKTAIEPPDRIFLLPKLGLHSPDYEKLLPKHQFFIILIWNVISGLKLMYQATPLVESSAKWFRINFLPITRLKRTQNQISLSPKLANGTLWPFSSDRSGGPKSSIDTIFTSTTGRGKQMELQTLYPASPKGLIMRRPLYELKILRSYTFCSLH